MARKAEHRVRLQKPLERSIRSGHPWLYRDALEPFDAEPGAVVEVVDKSGRFLGRGLADAGAIAVRVLTTRDEPIDAALFQRRIETAFALRARIRPPHTNAYRLLHGEGDRLAGIVCDRYAAFGVLKLDGEAAQAWQERVLEWLREPLEALGVHTLLVRGKPGRQEKVALAFGPPPPDELVVVEHAMHLAVSLWRGQKTGLFLDQRESRRRVRELAAGLRVLNLYGYTGGFSVAAGLGSAAHVTTIDSAAAALEHAQHSWALNGLDSSLHVALTADVPRAMTEMQRDGMRFDLVVSDPPNFAPSAAAKANALESYAALHAAALQVLTPGGYYLAASCSSHVTRADFERSLLDAARRSRRSLQVLERWGAPADHPRPLAFPEGDYLKLTLLRAE